MPCVYILEVTTMKRKSYKELIRLPSLEERLLYLSIGGRVGFETFGSSRYINQQFYRSNEWLKFRDYIIVRDNGCDMALENFQINGLIIIHHINPLTIDDFINNKEELLNEDNVVCTSSITHRAIHYATSIEDYIKITTYRDRTPFDTCPWKKGVV